MKVLDVECKESPVNIKGFEIIDEDACPFAFLGVELKNLYDQQRLIFNKKCDIKNVVHISYYPLTKTRFFRGIPVDVNIDLNKLIERINNYKEAFTNAIPVQMYKSILKELNVSCDSSISYLSEGVYPIDGECVDMLTNNNIKISEHYEHLLDNDKIPYYQSVGYLSVFIFSSTNTGGINNKKVFKEMSASKKNNLKNNK